MKKFKIINQLLLLTILILTASGCRGWKTEKPPIHPNINFDFQPKIKAQKKPLPVPENTLTYGQSSNTDQSLNDFDINSQFLANGQKNYNIYCAVCHTKTGNGTQSIISSKGWIVSNLHDQPIIEKSDIELYDVIKNGVRTMPGYGSKLNSKEIWQVVLYVRALQKVTHATSKEKEQLNQRKGS